MLCKISTAETITELRPVADTFVLNPSIWNIHHLDAAMYNYGGAGSRSVASATAYAYQEIDGIVIINDPPKGEFITLLKFDCSRLTGQHISDITLSLYISNGNQSSFGIFNYIGSAGDFDIAWVSNDWEQGTGSPHEMPSNSLDGISYNSLQTMLANATAEWLDTFYYSAENPYGIPIWYSYTFNLNNGHYSDLLAAIGRGETITFMLTASAQSSVAFNFTTYNQNTSSGITLRETGPILTVTTGLYGTDISDLRKLASYWLVTNCTGECGETDLNSDGIVNMFDFAILAKSWLKD